MNSPAALADLRRIFADVSELDCYRAGFTKGALNGRKCYVPRQFKAKRKAWMDGKRDGIANLKAMRAAYKHGLRKVKQSVRKPITRKDRHAPL
jgi:hypothetical protein